MYHNLVFVFCFPLFSHTVACRCRRRVRFHKKTSRHVSETHTVSWMHTQTHTVPCRRRRRVRFLRKRLVTSRRRTPSRTCTHRPIHCPCRRAAGALDSLRKRLVTSRRRTPSRTCTHRPIHWLCRRRRVRFLKKTSRHVSETHTVSYMHTHTDPYSGVHTDPYRAAGALDSIRKRLVTSRRRTPSRTCTHRPIHWLCYAAGALDSLRKRLVTSRRRTPSRTCTHRPIHWLCHAAGALDSLRNVSSRLGDAHRLVHAHTDPYILLQAR